MRAYIKKLQSKSEDSRKLIFTGMMIACMSIVGLIWFYSLGTRFNSDVKAQVNEDIKPFKLFSKSIGDTYNNISASIGNVPKIEDIKPAVEGPASSADKKQIDLIPVEYTNTNNQ